MGSQMIRIVVDIGSTVSAFGMQVYEKGKGDNWVVSPQFKEAWHQSQPTIILEKEKNPDAAFERDLFGKEALELSKKFKLHVSSEFKQYLYNDQGEKFSEARRLTVKYMNYIRECLENQRGGMSKELYNNTPKEVYVTVPLVASNGISDEMLKMAREAGFSEKNGYQKLEKMDEARSLADLILKEDTSAFYKELKILAKTPGSKESVMFIDIGGLTVDINLALISYDKEKNYAFHQIGIWPQASDRKKVNHLGGGITLDLALKDYLMKHKFIHPEATEKRMREHGCLDFREFKEYANEGFWKFGKTPDRLNGLGTDADEELYPERKYRKETGEQLTPECFIREVAADYIRTLTEGIRAAIRDGAAHTYANGLDIREETLDWLFITGGGSNIFFMKDWLLGNLPKEISTLNLAKIKANPERLLGLQVENKTLSCVEGGLVYTGRFILSAVADYSVELEIYPKYGKNRGDLPIFTQTLKIMEKGVALPLEVPFDMSVPFEYKNTLNGFEVTMNLLQNNMEDLSKKENLGKMASGKNALAVAKDVGKVALETGKAAGPAGLMIAVGGLLEGGRIPYGKELARMGKAAWINNSGNIQGKVNDLKSNLNFSRSHDEILKIGGCFRVDENRVLTGMISVKADSMKENQKPLEITLN